MQLIRSIWLYHNAFMLHQNMHIVVNGCRWFACLDVFTHPYTNIWLMLNMGTGGGFYSFLRLDFIFSVKAYSCCVISFWKCEIDPPLWCGNVLLTAERRYYLESSLMWELSSPFSSTMQKKMKLSLMTGLMWLLQPFLSGSTSARSAWLQIHRSRVLWQD